MRSVMRKMTAICFSFQDAAGVLAVWMLEAGSGEFFKMSPGLESCVLWNTSSNSLWSSESSLLSCNRSKRRFTEWWQRSRFRGYFRSCSTQLFVACFLLFDCPNPSDALGPGLAICGLMRSGSLFTSPFERRLSRVQLLGLSCCHDRRSIEGRPTLPLLMENALWSHPAAQQVSEDGKDLEANASVFSSWGDLRIGTSFPESSVLARRWRRNSEWHSSCMLLFRSNTTGMLQYVSITDSVYY